MESCTTTATMTFYRQPFCDERSEDEWEYLRMELSGSFYHTRRNYDDVDHDTIDEGIYLNELEVQNGTVLGYELWSEVNDWKKPITLPEAISMLWDQAVQDGGESGDWSY